METYDTSHRRSRRSGSASGRTSAPSRRRTPPRAGRGRAPLVPARDAPVPVGDPAHGHVLNYTMGDVVTHFRRRNGWRVLRPMGFDSFGLPAENAAIREGGHPREITDQNIEMIRAQMKRLGLGDRLGPRGLGARVGFYRWTQWLFLRFFERGLAYRKAAPVNWCPNDQTVRRERVRGRRPLRALRRGGRGAEPRAVVLQDHGLRRRAARVRPAAGHDWPERTKTIQRNWIGRSEGAELRFRVAELDDDVPVFTTRPDTLFGATFFVLAPEHPLVERIAKRRGAGVREAHGREARRGARGRGRRRESSPASMRRTRPPAPRSRSGSRTTS